MVNMNLLCLVNHQIFTGTEYPKLTPISKNLKRFKKGHIQRLAGVEKVVERGVTSSATRPLSLPAVEV